MSRTARFLVLACSLVVALPHGWCCVLAGQLTKVTAGTTERQTGGVPRVSATHKPAQQHSPTNVPNECPCADRQTVLTHGPSIAKCDAVPVAILPMHDHTPAVLIGLDAEAVCVVHPPTYHLHVFKCVWRC